MPAGRPKKDNELKRITGSRHYEPEVPSAAAPALKTPDIPPPSLSEDAQRQWIISVPSLASMNRVFEHHRTLLCILCSELACYYKETEPRERRLCAETIIDIQRELGLTVLSGLKLGSNGANAAPIEPVNARKR